MICRKPSNSSITLSCTHTQDEACNINGFDLFKFKVTGNIITVCIHHMCKTNRVGLVIRFE